MYYFNCILLIDDDPISNDITGELLRRLYFTDQIKYALSGTEGLEFIEEFHREKGTFPELILIDINMPGMDGFQFVEKLNSLPISKDDQFKISALTSSSNPEDMEMMAKLGVDHYIVKPLNSNKVKELLSAIN
jgi:CheY-like chemotaxis protein